MLPPRVRRALAGAGVLVLCLGACDAGEPPPNLLLISIDTLRPDHLGAYGYGRDTSPIFDLLAEEGVLFLDAVSSSPWTLPSHASLLTGLYPSRHGVKDHVNRLPDDVPSLATILAAEGYQTFAVVNSKNLSERFGLDQGFQSLEYVSEWEGLESDERRVVNRGDEIAQLGLRQVAQRNEDAPFFLFLHFYDVHTDLTPKPEYERLFAGPYDGPIDGSTKQLVDYRRQGLAIPPEDVQRLYDLYDAEIRQMDDVLGRIRATLEALEVSDSTLLVITSDHGEEFMEHGSILHGKTYYQEVIAIPLLFQGPGVPSGLRVEPTVGIVDVFPTLLALLGHDPRVHEVDGIDLAVHWRDPAAAPRGRFFFAEADHNNRIGEEEVPDLMRMLRVDDHKLIYDRRREVVELYDLAADPLETSDLSGEEARRVEALLERVRAFLASERSGEEIAPPTAEELDRLRALGY